MGANDYQVNNGERINLPRDARRDHVRANATPVPTSDSCKDRAN